MQGLVHWAQRREVWNSLASREHEKQCEERHETIFT